MQMSTATAATSAILRFHPMHRPASTAALAQGLLHRPGLATLAPLFRHDAARRLEAMTVDGLDQALAELGLAPPRESARAQRASLTVGGRLEAWLARPVTGRLGALIEALDTALWRWQVVGLGGHLAMLPLWHLRLHLAPVDRHQLQAARAWLDQGLDGWKHWHRARFGQIRCVAWDEEDRYCRSLGYRFQGRDYRIRLLMERLEHQAREWDRLAGGPLAPLLEAQQVWQRLGQERPLS